MAFQSCVRGFEPRFLFRSIKDLDAIGFQHSFSLSFRRFRLSFLCRCSQQGLISYPDTKSRNGSRYNLRNDIHDVYKA